MNYVMCTEKFKKLTLKPRTPICYNKSGSVVAVDELVEEFNVTLHRLVFSYLTVNPPTAFVFEDEDVLVAHRAVIHVYNLVGGYELEALGHYLMLGGWF